MTIRGTITDCHLNCTNVGVMRGLRVIGWPWFILIAHTVRSVYSNLNTRKKSQKRFAVSLKEVHLSARTVRCLNLNLKPALATGDRRPLSILRSYPCYVYVLRSHIIIVQFDKDGRFQRCFLLLGGAAYFTTKGVQTVSVRPAIVRMVVSGEVPVHNSMIGAEPRLI